MMLFYRFINWLRIDVLRLEGETSWRNRYIQHSQDRAALNYGRKRRRR